MSRLLMRRCSIAQSMRAFTRDAVNKLQGMNLCVMLIKACSVVGFCLIG